MKKVLTKNGLVFFIKGDKTELPITIRFDHIETERMLKNKIDFNKLEEHCETIHCEIAATCNKKCKYCYNEKDGKEISMSQWKKIFDDLARSGVFNVTFGGGEPLLRKDIIELAKYVDKLGMVVTMTTNGILLPKYTKEQLEPFRQINVSWHGNKGEVEGALSILKAYDKFKGINYALRQDYLIDIVTIGQLAKKYGAEVLFLTYKPLRGDKEQQIEPLKVYKYAEDLSKTGVRVAVDGLTLSDQCSEFCYQKRRFCDISAVGDMYPCSFIRKGMGNLLKESFLDIWKRKGIQERCPYLEDK